MSPFQSPWNFLGLPAELTEPARARAWILPIPYESTTSYGAGARGGPAAIIAASRQVETFDRGLNCEPGIVHGIHTLPPLALVHASPEAMVASIAEVVADLFRSQPRPELLGVFGGEHTITPGVVRGLVETTGDDLVVVQIDAHADLRDQYEGSPYSHACALRRVVDICPVFQIGIRNLSQEEEQFRWKSARVSTMFAEDLTAGPDQFAPLAAFVRGKRVYLTIDLDGLDPSIMPAVGTPEPGGLSWQHTLDVVQTVCREARQVPAFDLVELAPIPGLIAPDFLAAKLAYKIIGQALNGR